MNFALKLATAFVGLILVAPMANAENSYQDSSTAQFQNQPTCRSGYELEKLYSLDESYVIDEEMKCRVSTWDYEYFNDGFSKYFSITKIPNDNVYDFEVRCEAKRIHAYILVPYAYAIAWSGTGQFKIDSSSPKSMPYWTARNFSSVELKQAGAFLQSLSKAKNKFSFKIPTVDGNETMVFYKGNFNAYKSLFAKGGCKLF